jgi:hypothetical protein
MVSDGRDGAVMTDEELIENWLINSGFTVLALERCGAICRAGCATCARWVLR